VTSSAAKIFVVDDDEALLHTLGWVLRDKGYDVVSQPNGDDLLGRFAVEVPDLVLLDIMLPRIDGLELLSEIKAADRWRDLPILMLSSMPPEEATVRALGLGATDYIAKPFRVRELLARIAARLKEARELKRVREEARSRAEMVDILYEVTNSLKPDEIYHILTRRVARALQLSKCSMVEAQPGAETGVVVAAAENPMLRNLEISLAKYPELREALDAQRTVLITDVHSDPLYEQVREAWARDGVRVPTRSSIVLPFSLRGETAGVFFLRTTADDAPLTSEDVSFADRVINAAINAIERAYDLEAAKTDRERFQFLANTDPLTACLNRRAMLDRLERELARARRYRHQLSVLMIDIDWFKTINDTRGHLVGDSVLRKLGEMLKQEARSVDIVARYGGEEFTVILPDTDLEGGTTFAERLRERAEHYDFSEAGDPLTATISIGVATFADDGEMTAETMIERSDTALYRAKQAGRNKVRA
jgi:two-component system cell cycle response regulator